MTTYLTKPQDAAADFLATYYDRVVVSTPNQHGNVMLTALWHNDIEAMKWILRPDGQMLWAGFGPEEEPAGKATSEYLRRFRAGTL